MVKVPCPMPECNFVAEDVEPSIVAALLQIHASVHSSGGGASARGPKLDRPRIDLGADQEAWNTFMRRWDNFRIGSNISESIAPVQLLQCAGDDLSEMLLKTDPEISSRPIGVVLAEMKALAVIPVAKGIVRAELMQMHQANDESFRAFSARVRGKAETCGYSIRATCPCKCNVEFAVDYTGEAIRDVLLAGIGCVDIRQEVLSTQGVHEMTINQLVGFVEQREMARNAMTRRPVSAAASSNMNGGTTASLSSFKRQKAVGQPQASPRADQPIPCPLCGTPFHPFRQLRNGWNKKAFKECLSCWRSGRRTTRANLKAHSAECAIAQVAPPQARNLSSDGSAHQQPYRLAVGNVNLS